MNSDLFFENKKYISAKVAASITGYSTDYIGQLCRGNKIDSRRVGRVWYVSEEAAKSHKKIFETCGEEQVAHTNSEHIEKSRLAEKQYTANKKDFSVARGLVKFVAVGIVFVVTLVILQDIGFSKVSKSISSAPMSVYGAVDEMVNYYSKELGLKYLEAGRVILNASNSFTKKGIVVLNNPSTYVLDNFESLAEGEVGLVRLSESKTQNLVLSTRKKILAFLADSLGGVSDFKSNLSGAGTLTANVPSSISPVDKAGVVVYKNINSWFDKYIFSPASRFFATSQVVTPQTVPQILVKREVVPTKVINTTNVIERTIEKIAQPDITMAQVDIKLQELNNRLMSEFSKLSTGGGGAVANIYRQIAQSQVLGSISNTTVSGTSITGGSISGSSISAVSLTVTGTATSTFAGGIDIGSGCFAINGICIGTGSGSGIVPDGLAGQFPYYETDGTTLSATSSIFISPNGNFGVGTTSPMSALAVAGTITSDSFNATSTTATSTISGGLDITKGLQLNDGYIYGAGLTSCSGAGDKLVWDSATGQFSCGVDGGGVGTGISALLAEYSSAQNGATQTLATTSDTNIGLTITSALDKHTFTPTWTGTLSVARGGVGADLTGSSGILNYYNGVAGTIATSSLGLLTTDVAEGTNEYYTPQKVINLIHASTTIPKTYTANTFTALQTFGNASSTLFSSVYASSTNAYFGTVSLGGTDLQTTLNGKQNAITTSWPITLSGVNLGWNGLSTSSAAVIGNIPYFSGANTFANVATSSLAVGGSLSVSAGSLGYQIGGSDATLALNMGNANSWTANQTFNYSSTTYASFITASTTNLILNGLTFNSLLGSGLTNVGGALTLDRTGDWTGTIDGNNFAGGQIGAGDLLYGSGVGTISELAPTTNGYILTLSNGVPSWVATTTLTTISGILGTSQGGTGQNLGSANGILNYYNGVAGTVATSSLGLLTTNVAEGTNEYYTPQKVINLIHASTTIPKTYTANTFTDLQTWSYSSSTVYSSFATASTTNFILNGSLFNNLLGSGLSLSSNALTLDLANPNTWTNLQTFGNASSTALSALDYFSVGRNATTTIRGETNATSTFAGGIEGTYLNITGTNATSTFAGGIILPAGGLTISTLNCSGSGDLLQTDANGNVVCGVDNAGVSGGGIATIQENDSDVTTDATVIDFLGSDFDVTGATVEGNIAIDYLNSGITRRAQNESITGLWSFLNASSTALSALDYFSVGRNATTTIRGETNATSTFAGGIEGTYLNITGTNATSTFARGIDLLGGCFSINGTCLGGSSFVNTLANGGTATTTFYNGGVIFASSTGAGLLSQSSSAENFFWDETNKRLGLGTSTPFAKLSVNSIAGEPAFVVGSSTKTSFIVDASGNVGIGLIPSLSSIYNLDVQGHINTHGGYFGSSAQMLAGTVSFPSYQMGGNTAGMYSPSSGIGFTTASTERMRIDSTGNVGIGTTTPWAKLSVNNYSAGASTAPLFVVSSSTDALATSTQFIVTSTGNVGIGTANPTDLLTLKNLSTDTNLLIDSSAANRSSSIFLLNNGSGKWIMTNRGSNSDPSDNLVFYSHGQFNSGYETLTLDQNQNVIMGINGNVGIGTSTPLAKLNVYGGDTTFQTTLDSLTAFNILNSATTSVFSVATSGFGTTTLAGLNIAGQATSTSDVGWNLTGGCYAIGGNCLSAFTNTLASGGTATTTFYNGGVVFSDGTKLTQSSSASNFFWDETTKYLGLGTSTPFAKLAINPVAGDGNSFIIGSSTATNFVVTNAGWVGIGTVSPSQKLDVVGSIRIPTTVNSTSGVIYKGTTPFIHDFTAAGTSGANTFIGLNAGNFTMAGSGAQASNNTAVGWSSLLSNTTGSFNTANGVSSLYNNTTGSSNTANGVSSLQNNTTGSSNTANGQESLYNNTTGSFNTANGMYALNYNTTGNYNTANGMYSLWRNTSATSSAAIGYNAARGTANYSNQGGVYLGYQAGYSAATGSDYNTLLGYQSGYGVTTGARNVLIGQSTIATSQNQVTTGSNNIAIGNDVAVASSTANNQLNIGNLIYGTGLDGTGSTLSAGFIGIGTTTPQWLLNPFSSTAPQLALSAGAGISQWVFRNAGGNLYFATTTIAGTATTTTSALTILNNGNVGIGTSSPLSVLSIQSKTSISDGNPILSISSPSGAPAVNINRDDSLNGDVGLAIGSVSNIYDSAHWSLYVNGGNNTGAFIGGGMTVENPDGIVSRYGYNSDLNALTAYNFNRANNNTSNINFDFLNSDYGSYTGIKLQATQVSYTSGSETDDFSIQTKNLGSLAERFRITGAGNVGIGTTTPLAKLNVYGNTVIQTPVDLDRAFYVLDSATSSVFNVATTGFGTTTLSGLTISGQATSTSNVGWNLTGGCYAIGGNCLTAFTNSLASGGTATTTFYNGGVVFSDGTKLTQSSSAPNFFWDETTKYLGLGTSTPFAKLAINPVAGDGNSFVIGSSTATNFVVTNAGNVGIGTSNVVDTTKLSVVNNSTTGGDMISFSSLLNNQVTQGNSSLLNISYSGANVNSSLTSYGIKLNNSRGGTDSTNVGGYFSASGATRNYAIIVPLGKTGLGIQSPTATLHVLGENPPGGGGGTTELSSAPDALNVTGGTGASDDGDTIASGRGGDIIMTGGTGGDGWEGATGQRGGNITLNGGVAGNLASAGNIILANLRGAVGIGTTSPFAKLAINPVAGDGNSFVIGSSTATNFVVTNAGNVGIGTGSPTQALQVNGTVNFVGNYVGFYSGGGNLGNAGSSVGGYFGYNGDSTTGLYSGSGMPLLLGAGGAESVRITSTGDIGIGTTTPQWLLNPFSSTAPQLALSAGAGISQWAFRNAGGNLYFATTTVDGTATTSTPVLTITNEGKMGLGTSTPGAKLEVAGPTEQIRFSYDTTNYGSLTALSSGLINIGTKGVNNLKIGTDPTLVGFSNIWPGGTVTPDSNNYAWQAKNDGSQVWFNAASGGYLAFTINNSSTLPIMVKGTNVGIGYLYSASIPSLFSVNGDAFIAGGLTLPNAALDSLLSTDASGLVVATSTPTFGNFNATSTNATSTIAGGLAIGTNKFVVDYSSGNVGIGTDTPLYTLDVKGPDTDNAVIARFFSNNGARGSFVIRNGVSVSPTTLIGTDSSSEDLGVMTNNTERIRIQGNSGFVGIASTTPWGLLSVNPDGITGPSFVIGSSTATNFVVTNEGRVGIGTAAPGYVLDVSGGTSSFRSNGAGTQYPLYLWNTQTAAANVGIYTQAIGQNGAGLGTYGLAWEGAATTDAFMSFNTRGSNAVNERMRITSAGNVGIGTTAPTYRLDVKGTTAAQGIRSDMGFDINPVTKPTFTSANLALAAGGSNLGVGAYIYTVTYTTALGETDTSGTAATITTDASNRQVTITLPVSTDPRVTGRKIYRTTVGGLQYQNKVLIAIANNTDVTYLDDIADGSLTGSTDYFRSNTTSKFITLGGAGLMNFTPNSNANTFLGYGVGNQTLTNGRNVGFGSGIHAALTSGAQNTAIGNATQSLLTTGTDNVTVGYGAMNQSQGSNYNVGVGTDTLFYGASNAGNVAVGYFSGFGSAGQNVSGSTALGFYTNFAGTDYSVHLGYYAGRYETADNKLIIDSLNRSTEEASRTGALLYGVFDATPANQVLVLGGGGNVGIGTTSPISKLHVEGSTTASGANAVAGIFATTTLTNSTGSGFQFGNRFLNTVNGTTAGTEVGTFIRMTDSTSLVNTVRGLEVQAWSGTNTLGTNAGIVGFGKTFGLQGTTDALAGAVSQPAAVFADLDNATAPTAGNAIRAYSDNATSANLVSIYQESSAYTGNALIMDIGNVGSGSGSFASGNFISLKNAGTENFHVASDGRTFVSLVNNGTYAVCQTANGNNSNAELTDCNPSVNADYAEMYPIAEGVTFGEVVTIGTQNVTTTDGAVIKQLVRSARPYDSNAVGIVSNNFSDFTSAGYNLDAKDNPMPVALIGRVPVKFSLENGPVSPGDYITTSATPGAVMKATRAGMVIGQAISDYDSTTGTVMVFVKSFYNDPGVVFGEDGNITLQNGTSTMSIIANTQNASAYVINQQGSGDLLQLQLGGIDKFLIKNNGSVYLNASTIDPKTELFVTKSNDENVFTINARGDVAVKGNIFIRDNSFAGSIATNAQGEAEIIFTYDLGTGKPSVQLTPESDNPVFAQISGWTKDSNQNYIGFKIKTFGLNGDIASSIVHYLVAGKSDGYDTSNLENLVVMNSIPSANIIPPDPLPTPDPTIPPADSIPSTGSEQVVSPQPTNETATTTTPDVVPEISTTTPVVDTTNTATVIMSDTNPPTVDEVPPTTTDTSTVPATDTTTVTTEVTAQAPSDTVTQ